MQEEEATEIGGERERAFFTLCDFGLALRNKFVPAETWRFNFQTYRADCETDFVRFADFDVQRQLKGKNELHTFFRVFDT